MKNALEKCGMIRRSRGMIYAGLAAMLLAMTCPVAAAQAAPDIHFMQRMIHHHAQALEMTKLVPQRSTSEKIHLLARRIEISQQDEIKWMTDWLEQKGVEAPEHDRHDGQDEHGTASDGAARPMMPGMLTDEQMAQLENATGPDFDRLFLQFMIVHHQGALTMVEELFSSHGAAQDTDVFRFASGIDSDQRGEIGRMQTMLDALNETEHEN